MFSIAYDRIFRIIYIMDYQINLKSKDEKLYRVLKIYRVFQNELFFFLIYLVTINEDVGYKDCQPDPNPNRNERN